MNVIFGIKTGEKSTANGTQQEPIRGVQYKLKWQHSPRL